MYCSCRISTDKCLVRSLCNSRVSCFTRSKAISVSTGPIFTIFLPNGRYLRESSWSCPVFTARHYAKRGICRRRVSVCLSVCLCVCVCMCVYVSVTLRYCIKTAKRRITQITPHYSSGNSSFQTPKFTAKFERDHPLRVRQMHVGWVKIRHFLGEIRITDTTRVLDLRSCTVGIETATILICAKWPLFYMLAFPNVFDYRNFDSKRFNGNISSTYCAHLIKIGPVTPEITRAKTTPFWTKR